MHEESRGPLRLSRFELILLSLAAGFVLVGEQFSMSVLTDMALVSRACSRFCRSRQIGPSWAFIGSEVGAVHKPWKPTAGWLRSYGG